FTSASEGRMSLRAVGAFSSAGVGVGKPFLSAIGSHSGGQGDPPRQAKRVGLGKNSNEPYRSKQAKEENLNALPGESPGQPSPSGLVGEAAHQPPAHSRD